MSLGVSFFFMTRKIRLQRPIVRVWFERGMNYFWGLGADLSLPAPRAGDPPPSNKLSDKAHSAIFDDGTVDRQVRVAVIFDLEASPDLGRLFGDMCDGESLLGPALPSGGIILGRAMTLHAFHRGLVEGWFGSSPMDADIARDVVDQLKDAYDNSGADGASMSKFRALLDPGLPLPILPRRVTWYFFDQHDSSNPMKHVDVNLALKLALPSAAVGSGRDYIVFKIDRLKLNDPRRPRFTDSGALSFLDFWRPGGQTSPWITGLEGLDEVVDTPTVVGAVSSEYHIVFCDES
ncbi:hypothetical protein [Rhizobium sp. NRK18]|uniref:hypothetical protein n=1 Tax=Rhizobium sp. NRK18 TaxID=2964667 RepID=UPI0021C2A4D9|nr:hypothetical protein [Rhizobium sp. NRK18]MCQ2002873.1 hypothetical protein [Rhizobium sp. NRK18]